MTPPITGVQVRLNGAWVPLGTAAPPPPPLDGAFPGDPGPGKIMWGQTRQGNTASDGAARAVDYQHILGLSSPVYPKAFRLYITPFASIAAGKNLVDNMISNARLIQSWGSIPFVDSKELANTSFAQIGTGAMDAFLDYLMEQLVSLGGPVILGYHQEPAGDTIGGVKNDYAGYAAAVGRFAQRRDLAGGKPFITITGCLGIGAFPGQGDPLNWLRPLAPVCDVWGSHHYIQTQPTDSDSKWNSTATMAHLVGDFWDIQDSVDSTKARVHGEWGVHVKLNDRSRAPQVMDQFLTYGISRNLRAACLFDSGISSPKGVWTLDGDIATSLGSNPPDTITYIPDTTKERLIAMAHELVDPRVVGPAPL